jgi:hypothetical protein
LTGSSLQIGTRYWKIFFSDYEVFIGQDELIFSATQGIGEIYKIHGSCSRPNSVVLTDEDYTRFHERNPYLAAKLLTTFVEHPIIFLGYSLSDGNVRSVLRAIASCLTTTTITELRNRLVFIQWEPGKSEVNTDATFVIDGFTLPVVTLRTGELLPIFAALSETERRFPAKLLRRLKRHVYELVLTNNAREKIVSASRSRVATLLFASHAGRHVEQSGVDEACGGVGGERQERAGILRRT